MKRRCSAVVVALLLALSPAFSQMFRIQGGAGTVSGSQGGGFSVYQPDATSAVGLSYSDGLRFGFSRTVTLGGNSLVVGDSNLVLRLPTDFGGDGRGLLLRGLTLNANHMLGGGPEVGISSFVGWTGNGYRSTFQSAVSPTNPIQILSGHVAVARSVDLSAVAVHGTRSSFLTSGLWTMTPRTDAALTLGYTGGVPLLRVRAKTGGDTWKGEVSYTSGSVRLQPEPELLTATVERVGWNGSATKRFGSWLVLDAGRQEYNTADAVDAAVLGVTGARSSMIEGGATVRHGPVEGGIRLLQSTSGVQSNGGQVVIAGWHSRTVNVLGTGIRNRNVDGSITTSASIDTTERLSSRLKLTEGTTFANGSPTFDFGGGYEGPWGSASVDHRETYIPFGAEAGFHRVLSLSVRLHIRGTEVGADQVIGSGLPLLINLSGDSFLGSDLGPIATPASHMSTLPKYAVEGVVRNAAGEPVRGAAVAAGPQVAYTDSEGHFLLRFSQAKPVALIIEPSLFLTPESYQRVDAAMTVTPAKDGENAQVTLHVERSTAGAGGIATAPLDATAVVGGGLPAEAEGPGGHRPGALQRAWSSVVKLCRAMVRPKG